MATVFTSPWRSAVNGTAQRGVDQTVRPEDDAGVAAGARTVRRRPPRGNASGWPGRGEPVLGIAPAHRRGVENGRRPAPADQGAAISAGVSRRSRPGVVGGAQNGPPGGEVQLRRVDHPVNRRMG